VEPWKAVVSAAAFQIPENSRRAKFSEKLEKWKILCKYIDI